MVGAAQAATLRGHAQAQLQAQLNQGNIFDAMKNWIVHTYDEVRDEVNSEIIQPIESAVETEVSKLLGQYVGPLLDQHPELAKMVNLFADTAAFLNGQPPQQTTFTTTPGVVQISLDIRSWLNHTCVPSSDMVHKLGKFWNMDANQDAEMSEAKAFFNYKAVISNLQDAGLLSPDDVAQAQAAYDEALDDSFLQELEAKYQEGYISDSAYNYLKVLQRYLKRADALSDILEAKGYNSVRTTTRMDGSSATLSHALPETDTLNQVGESALPETGTGTGSGAAGAAGEVEGAVVETIEIGVVRAVENRLANTIEEEGMEVITI